MDRSVLKSNVPAIFQFHLFHRRRPDPGHPVARTAISRRLRQLHVGWKRFHRSRPGYLGLWWTGRDELALLVSCTCFLIVGGCWWHQAQKAPLPRRLLMQRDLFCIEINQASTADWQQLSGIGPALSRRIVSHRQTHGPFRTLAELQLVRGIGPRTLDRIRPWIRIETRQPTNMASQP